MATHANTSRLVPAIGIDLGTTYSVLARLDESGRPVTVPNAEGDLLTPSVVFFDEREVVVGKEAAKALASEAALIAVEAKREMGARHYHRPLGGRELPPEVVEAFVLAKLVADARAQLGELRQAVITVPAYFDEVRRRATQDAGFMAGLEVLDIINEPTAAALAYGQLRGSTGADERVVVYDLGGGTFDVTVMDLRGRECVTLATDGDVRLGGSDWDERLVDHLAAEFIRAFDVDPRQDPNARARLARECEDAKRTLSARQRTTVAFDWRGHALRSEITRELFERLTKDLLDRTRFTTRQALAAAGLTWNDVSRVLLVGGSSRMPAVRTMLRQLSGREPDAAVAADEAVAHGAALHAGALLAESAGRPTPLRIRNVNSHSLGVVATEPATRRRHNAIIIPRNTPLPVTARRTFQTQKRQQRSLLIQVLEGESTAPEGCSVVARCVVRHLPEGLPAKTPVEVRFTYRADGTLGVVVLLPGDSRVLEADLVRPNSLSRAELNRWRNEIERRQVPRDDGEEVGNWADTK